MKIAKHILITCYLVKNIFIALLINIGQWELWENRKMNHGYFVKQKIKEHI